MTLTLPPDDAATPRGRRFEAQLLLGAVLLLAYRTALQLAYRFDSDEPQHLHVTWGWSRGLLAYRDHMPLFHVLTAPLLRAAGERADILALARWWMLPLALGSAALAYSIGRRIASPPVAIAAAVLFAFAPTPLLKGLEFRNDNLWTFLVLAAIAVLVRSRGRTRDGAMVGGFLGLAFATSMKTSLVAVALLLTFVTLVVEGTVAPGLGRYRGFLAAAVAAALAPLAAFAAFFAAHGALADFWFGAVGFNGKFPIPLGRRVFAFGIFLVVLLTIWNRIRGRFPVAGPEIVARRFLLWFGPLFFLLHAGAWPLPTIRDTVPAWAIVAAAGSTLVAERWPRAVRPAFAGALLLSAAITVWTAWISGPGRRLPAEAVVAAALRLTDPGEPVIDIKGETIFRPRAYRWTLETVGRELVRLGEVPDTIERDALRERVLVVGKDNALYPPNGRRFLLENYVDVGAMRVAGVRFDAVAEKEVRFSLPLAARYVAITREGPAPGLLDGTPVDGARELAAGSHTFRRIAPGSAETVVYSERAFVRGASPFADLPISELPESRARRSIDE